MSENEIIVACQKGKLENFGELYEKYFNEIYKFVYLKTYNEHICQDIVSETFLKALNKINSFKVDEKSNFRAWLYRISYNLIVDNSKKVQFTTLEDFMEIGGKNTFGEDLDNKQKLKKVFKYFDTLNKKHKEILIMRFWDDLSFKEISEITGESLSNCKKIVSRTLQKLPGEELFILLILLLNL